MITDDRNLKVVDRNKIKYVLDVLEYVDIETPFLVKRGDDYFWIIDPNLAKEKENKTEEDINRKTLKEWFSIFFGPTVYIYINFRLKDMLKKSSPKQLRLLQLLSLLGWHLSI